jgi:hypothetical protein
MRVWCERRRGMVGGMYNLYTSSLTRAWD